MSFITAPTLRIKSIQWNLERPTQINRSIWTGAETAVSNPWHGRWSAQVQLAPLVGEASIRAYRGFLASLLGRANTFALKATEGAQHGSGGPQTATAGAAAGATSIALSASPALVAGMLATVSLPSGNKQLVMLTAAISGSTITFQPGLREAISTGAQVETANPYAMVRMTNDKQGWAVDQGQLYGAGFEVEEAF